MSIWDEDTLKGVTDKLKEYTPDTMTFMCREEACEFSASCTCNLFDYWEKLRVQQEMVDSMKKHKEQTKHERGEVYHNGKMFLRSGKWVE